MRLGFKRLDLKRENFPPAGTSREPVTRSSAATRSSQVIPLSPTEAIYFPPAFDEYGQAALRQHVPTLIEVRPEEAERFAGNAVVVGKHVALNTGCPELERSLSERGYTPHATELGEFIKAGGSAKCLTLRLDGEDAAIWP
ncbi:MAG: amidinotransferase [Planctomycetota bacterium]|nr:MAG: amidinotransferase [Planctomycetota bacterium]